MYLELADSNGIAHRNSIGGYPVLPMGIDWPICPFSHKKMVHFLQFDFPSECGIGKGFHLTIFMSPDVNEIPWFEMNGDGNRLPDMFWEKYEKHFKVFLFRGEEAISSEEDPYLVHKRLVITNIQSDSSIRVGGEPNWLQDEEVPFGPSGEVFTFLAEIPESYPFQKKEEATEQVDSFSKKDYCLFLSNQVYIFGCKDIADINAVWLTVQS